MVSILSKTPKIVVADKNMEATLEDSDMNFEEVQEVAAPAPAVAAENGASGEAPKKKRKVSLDCRSDPYLLMLIDEAKRNREILDLTAVKVLKYCQNALPEVYVYFKSNSDLRDKFINHTWIILRKRFKNEGFGWHRQMGPRKADGTPPPVAAPNGEAVGPKATARSKTDGGGTGATPMNTNVQYHHHHYFYNFGNGPSKKVVTPSDMAVNAAMASTGGTVEANASSSSDGNSNSLSATLFGGIREIEDGMRCMEESLVQEDVTKLSDTQKELLQRRYDLITKRWSEIGKHLDGE